MASMIMRLAHSVKPYGAAIGIIVAQPSMRGTHAMRNERLMSRSGFGKPACEPALNCATGKDGLEDYDLRETLDDIVVGNTTFSAFRAALASFRSRLH
jgi:hypothetical protein